MEHLLGEYAQKNGVEIVTKSFLLPFDLDERVEGGDSFDLYLLDIYMPGMTGIALAEQIRRIGIEAPIVFLTTSKDHALEAFGVGASQYILKPFDAEVFYKAIDTVAESLQTERRRSIVLKSDGEMHNISVRNILYC